MHRVLSHRLLSSVSVFALCLSASVVGTPASAAFKAGTWTKVGGKNSPLCGGGSSFLLTDGRVLIQDNCGFPNNFGTNWWTLTPDNTGSYTSSSVTWTQVASIPASFGYGPLYMSSYVLANGNLIINGGEYNLGPLVWIDLGAYFNPQTNNCSGCWIQGSPPTSGSGSWIQVNPPTGWTSIGDGQSTILQNGNYMIADCCSTRQAILDLANLTWLPTGSNFRPSTNNEAGWTLLPDDSVLTVDMTTGFNAASTAYRYLNGTWYCAGTTQVQLIDEQPPSNPDVEMGPWVLLPNGTVFAVGGSGNNAIYTPPPPGQTPPAGGSCNGPGINTGTWTAGPSYPSPFQNYRIADGPGALLPNGNVLLMAAPGDGQTPVQFFEYTEGNPGTLNVTANTTNAPTDVSYNGRLLVLPTGQILQTDNTSDIEVYSPNGQSISPIGPPPGYSATWAPTITTPYPLSITRGLTYTISGTLFNGMSQANAYGDDVTSGTNYPLIRVTNQGTGHVFYGHTHDHSSMGVAQTTKTVSTKFEIPSTINLGVETGPFNLQIVANGIPSQNVVVTLH